MAVFALVVSLSLGVNARRARGQEGSDQAVEASLLAEESLPTAQQTKELLESPSTAEPPRPQTNPQVAEELPHRDLDGQEALELAEGVFGAQLEGLAGIYNELEPEKFLSDNAAVVPASTLSESSEEQGSEAPSALGPAQPLLIESTLPLRTENADGEVEAVDLSLESPEGSGGELQPQNPLAEVAIPAHLGEGISLGGVQIAVAGAAQESAPTNVEEQYAFYANVAQNTDLIVAPTPTGVETMTAIRSAEADTTTTYELSLPAGAELKASEGGGAEVVQGGRTTMRIPPPSAIDAAGDPVPVELEVSGEDLRVVASPGPEASYPILVDPEFIQEAWYWSSNHDSLAAWSASTTQWSLCPVPYALWMGPTVPGLGLSSGCDGNSVPSGTHADWTYLVPRYLADLTNPNFGTPPTSFVYQLYTQGNQFVTYGNKSTYPALVWGLINPNTGWAGDEVWYGYYGEQTNWSTGYAQTNLSVDPAVKGADINLVTYANEAPAIRRDAFVGTATVAVADMGAPVLKELVAPSKWLDTTAEPIKYAVEDTGLGVKAAWASYEATAEPGWGFELGCAGTAVNPCPRLARSGETAALSYDPKALPTGKDRVIFAFDDPVFGPSGGATNHATGGIVTLKIDHTAPDVTLSGALTEQGSLGTLKSEYPLSIKALDGTEADPQSGVVKAEVKVDGKTKSTWNPGCASENCSFSGSWTLKTSEYTAASHEVEVLVTDAAGVVSENTIEVDLGEAPPQTSFTSPHPRYEVKDLSTISFKATRGGAPVAGATFRCSLDEGETPTEPCASPFELPKHPGSGLHTFSVAAVDGGGKVDPTPARWTFETDAYPAAPRPSEKLVYPEAGKTTASYYTLEAEWGGNPEGKAAEGVTGVTFQMQLPGLTKNGAGEEVPRTFETVPAECVIDGEGHQVSWPLRPLTHPGHNKPVYLKVRGCPAFEAAKYPEKEIQFRAVFDGGAKVAGASAPVATEFIYNTNTTRVPTDAVETVGPASVDLLTGAFTLSRTDVSIPVPGYQANLEFTRVYHSSSDAKRPGSSLVLGGAWQPSSPLESEGEGEAWTRIEEKEIPYHPAVYGHECWPEWEEDEEGTHFNEHQECEEWLEEEEQPRIQWIELFDNEGAGIPFEIAGENYISPDWAKELKLYKEAGNFVLAYPNGTHTTFVSDEEGHFVPKYISYQATPGSMRLVYEKHGKELRLEREIAPSPVVCPDWESVARPGCRTLEFRYATHNFPAGGSATLLESIAYWGPTGNPEDAQLVAWYGYTEMASPSGGPGIALTTEADPRTGLPEYYSYASSPYSNQLTGLLPPGQEPWVFSYQYNAPGNPNPGEKPTRLKTVTRGAATTTIAYEVPVKGAGAPYDMSPEAIGKWGQTDLPVDATAIFPPTHMPGSYPPSEYTGATVHYMDPEGHEVNTASPSPPGVSGASITTSETDMKGNVVRALGARNRLTALESAESAAVSHQLDSHSIYNANGTEMLESWGPLHEVRLESGELVQARSHTVTRYDEGEPTPPAGTPPAHLPTKETVAAVVPGKEGEFEPRVTETRYDWRFRQPEETVADPAGLNIRSITKFNSAGQVIETRQPKGAAGGTAGDTQSVYYSATGEGACVSKTYANLPCQVLPAAQASGTGRPQLLVKKFSAYNYLDQPTEVVESPGGETGNTRKTIIKYDKAGRQLTQKIEGGGAEVPKTETVYSASTGMPEKQQFVCESQCGPAGSFQSAFGSAGTGNGQFNHPSDVAFDSKGNIWVTDTNNHRIEEFSESGEFLRAVGSRGTLGGQLKSPSALAVDSSNNVWVADTTNNRIAEFNEKAEFVAVLGRDVNKTKVEAKGTEAERNYCSAASGDVCQAGPEGTAPGQLKAPQGIAVTSSGSIWVADTDHSRMEKFSPTGALLNNSFSEGSEVGKLKAPTAVAMGPGGSLWVADTGNNRIEHWSASLTSPVAFGSEGTENGKFKHPDALEVLASGKVWVGDEGNSRIEAFTEAGGYIGKFGAAGAGAGQFSFSSPIGLAVDSKGNIWVTDPGHNMVQKWAPTEATDTQATTVHYNAFGQPTEYEDADGNVAKTTYDAYGRPLTTKDNKGSQTVTYDPLSGVVTKLEDSAAGTFTATYNADGSLIERGLPNGLTAKTAYNAAGEPMSLSYTKTTFCGESCTWLQETLQRSISGQIVSDNGTLVNDAYSYDKAGRLTEARETPAGGTCTTRAYTYDADSNRLSKATRSPGIGGACMTSGGAEQKYSYDEADRLITPTYDAWGRTTNLPAEFAGGKALETSYYSTNMVASQTQGAITNSYELDAGGRQRARLQGGGLEGTEIFHYDGGSDSPTWTERGSIWTRNIAGIGGELAAIQDSSVGMTFRLTNLHGDVVAVADPSPNSTKLKETLRFDEFGSPMSGSAGRFGWLGGNFRRSELPSGVIQMGARSYIPQLGRFLTPDPIRGGSANAYDYAGQDPINGFDLGGKAFCSTVHTARVCGRNGSELSRNVKRANKQYKHDMAAARRASREVAAGTHHHPVLVIGCHCRTPAQHSNFESVLGDIGAAITGAGVAVVAVGSKKLEEVHGQVGNWSPDHLLQGVQCGWALGEAIDGKDTWKQQCDPVELWVGPPDSAR